MKKYKPSVSAKPIEVKALQSTQEIKLETEVKSPFWESVVSFAKPKEETLSDMINALEPKKEVKRFMGSVFTENFTIKGNVSVEEALMISGTVFGNIQSTSDVSISEQGRVHGDVVANALTTDGSITGDVKITSSVETHENSVIFGNIEAESIQISGKVEGNLVASAKIILKAHANVKGNLWAQSFEVEEGATIDGRIEIQTKVKTTESNDFIVSYQ